MKTVQMTLEESLLDQVDQAVERLGTSRSAFARQAFREALNLLREKDLEARHRAGYEKKPVEPGEFGNWEPEQAWGD